MLPSSIYLTTFVIPFMLLCYFYSSIGIQLKHRELPGNADPSRDLTMQTKRAKVSWGPVRERGQF